MSYTITNQHNSKLCAFHSNGGWEINDVFPCGKDSWYCFASKAKAQAFITRIIDDCERQRARWGNWTDTAIQFAKKLKVAN